MHMMLRRITGLFSEYFIKQMQMQHPIVLPIS
jgi:hypothetical protein